MPKLVWDEDGKRLYETGTRNGVLYVKDKEGKYPNGVVWNGLTSVTEKPTGADQNKIYADDGVYGSFRSIEEFEATIEAYTYPDEFAECDGSVEIVPGLTIGQQGRKAFGLSYRTVIGNDIEGDEFGYKIHLIYGATASPSEKPYASINDSPDAITFSWDLTTVPVAVEDRKPTALFTIDSTKLDKDKLKELEEILYGSEENEARLPMPDEIIKMFAEG